MGNGYVDAGMVRKRSAATIAGFIQNAKDQDVNMPGIQVELGEDPWQALKSRRVRETVEETQFDNREF